LSFPIFSLQPGGAFGGLAPLRLCFNYIMTIHPLQVLNRMIRNCRADHPRCAVSLPRLPEGSSAGIPTPTT
ncbi:MAG: hypothetical protein ILP09_09600, partial [Oscillospiraceae bacterium]|nr:hypothetical protein [Oscillospiraceae bacterium]